MAVNRVAILEQGLYPPFKPKQRLTKEDFYIPYRDIASMRQVLVRGSRAPAYDITLKDGLTFQLNALDLLLYVGEKGVRRYEKMVAVIREEPEKPENQARAARGDDVVITRERFERVSPKPTVAEVATAASMFWYFVILGIVVGFIVALIIGLRLLR